MNKFATYFSLALAVLLFAPLPALAAIRVGESNLNVLSNGLVGYWSFDGTDINGTTVTDLSGQGDNGTITSSWVVPAVGKIGQALNFPGIFYDQVTVKGGGFILLGDTSFTISAWVKTTENPGITGAQSSAVYSERGYGNDILKLEEPYDVCQTSISLTIRNDQGTLLQGPCGTITTNDGKWHLVTVTLAGSVVTTYVDGQVDAVGTWSGVGGTFTDVSGDNSIIGGDAADSSSYFPGTIDDVRLYNRALSSQEISLLYAMGSFQLGNTQATNSSFSIAQGGLNGGLIGYWPLDGNTTNWATGITEDISGNGYNGQMIDMSTTTSPVPGVIGQAFKFNASQSQYVTAGPIIGLSSASQATICAWLYRTSSGNVISFGDGSNSTAYRFDAIWYNDGNIYFGYGNGDSSAYAYASLPGIGWQHICEVFNGALSGDAIVAAYSDGISLPLSYVDAPPATLPTSSNIGNFLIGSDVFQGFDNGTVDDVRVYSRALSAQEIEQLYKAGKVNIAHSNTTSGTGLNAGLVGYWTFDGPTINWATGVVKDMSGQANNGQMTGMSTSSSPIIGKIGQALNFTGSNYLTTPTNSMNFQDTSAFSVSMWEKTTVTSNQYIVSTWEFPTSAGWALDMSDGTNGASGAVTLLLASPTGGSARAAYSTATNYDNGQWHLVTATYNGSQNASGMTFYIDGKQTPTIVSGNNNAPGTLSNAAFGIGHIPGYGSLFFTGSLDDLRVYNRVLSAQEVAQLYAAGH